MQDVNMFEVWGRGRLGSNCSIQSETTTGLRYLLGNHGNVFLGSQVLGLLVSSKHKTTSSGDPEPGQNTGQVSD